MEDYIDKFEELRAEVMGQMPQASKHYSMSVFVSGLKEELRHLLKMFKPTSLDVVDEQAIHLQSIVSALSKLAKPTPFAKTLDFPQNICHSNQSAPATKETLRTQYPLKESLKRNIR